MSRRRSRGNAARTRPAPSTPARPAAARVRSLEAVVVRDRRWRTAIPVLLVLIGLAAYHNSFAGPFLLDDEGRIVQNPQIRSLWPPWEVVARSQRPVLQLSLAVNFALGGLRVWGYHAFNVSVHLLAGLALYGVVRRMFGSERLRERYGTAAPWLALVVAALWMVHPLQTASVTYVIQRAESLMGL